MTITVVESGDIRMQVAGRVLERLGYSILRVNPDAIPPMGECLLLPIPSHKYLSEDYSGYTSLIGAGLPVQLLEQYTQGGVHVIDLLAHPAFVEENARLTAEAAISLGMEASGRSYCGTDIHIIGFGRIAKTLTQYLVALGAHVCVYARREDARAETIALGAEAHPLAHLAQIERPYLFNTVPAPILTEEITARWQEGVLIELASGNQIALPKASPLRVIDGGALPGRRLPVSAGALIANTIHSLFTKEDSYL